MPPEGDGVGLSISPSGRIHWDCSPFDRCFAAGNGSGLLATATAAWPADAGVAAFFLRSMARDAITRLAHACSEYHEDDLHALDAILPPAKRLTALVEALPPVPGGEYVTVAMAAQWHRDLAGHIRRELEARANGVAEWLQGLGEPWNRIGRLFFHLAENRDDATGAHPFAFLATFAHKSTVSGELSHLPLGRAVQLYHDDHRALLALLKPLEQASGQSPLLASILRDRSVYGPIAWNARQTQEFLRDIPVFESAGIIVRMVNLWKKPPAKLQLSVTAEQEGGHAENNDKGFSVHSILSFSVAASLGGRHLTPEELEMLLASDGGLLRFQGEWVDVDAAKIRQLLDRWQQATRMMNRLGIPLVQGLRLLVHGRHERLPELPPRDPDCELVPGPMLAESLRRLSHPRSRAALCIPAALNDTLRPYQKEGADFLDRTTGAGFGACLADDMGLGKTLQCLAWLTHLQANGHLSGLPALVVAPASLLGNWQEEASRFAPGLDTAILHPSAVASVEWKQLLHQPKDWLERRDVVVTTYGMATRLDWMRDFEFSALVLDEAQAVKNAGSQRSIAIRQLQARRKAALSGTPVENSLNELWSLMDILNPGLLGGRKPFEHFTASLGNDFTPLRRLVHPFILRRMKTDPALVPDLPDKTDVQAYCLLTAKQAALYKSQVDALHAVLEEPDPATRMMLILPYLAKFKQICNHPAQFLGRGEYDDEDSGKFMRLRQLAGQIAARQEKLILFTQFRTMMDPLHHLLSTVYGRSGLMLHGETPIAERQQLVNRFQQEEGPPFFVLSLKAAGTGLTLTQANHVIHFDRWWNPAVENQATDRAYRIGQHRNVLVHRLICRGTIEDRIDRMLRQKQQLADSLFEGGVEKLLIEMSPEDIRTLVEGP